MASGLSSHRQQLLQQREELRARLLPAVEDEEDPLAAYDNFVKWTLQNYANHSDSGLLELLEESVRRFLDDVRYKIGDLRYVKLWILFANHVEKPAEVYTYMFQEGIGKPYAVFFEEYAEALEREGRFAEAETVITLGIRTQARPVRHLQSFHSDYTARKAAGRSLPEKVSPFREGACSQTVSTIRKHPLQNLLSRHTGNVHQGVFLTVPAVSQHDLSMTTTQTTPLVEPTRPSAYAHLNAPTAPGKKPEKLQFDLTLLLDPDGTEYCFEEARARHLGLLGKKWPPPPQPNPTGHAGPSSAGVANVHGAARERSVKIDFNDQGTKTRRGTRRQSVTVTINTKQALEDVFDMYNSPVKDSDNVEDHQDDPKPWTTALHKSQNTPVTARPVLHDENAKPHPFQPYAEQRRENPTPGPLKFMPVTVKTPGANTITPSTARGALVAKEITTPVPAFKVVRSEQNAITPKMPSDLRSLAEEPGPDEINVFGGDDVTVQEITELTDPPPVPRSFMPFVDEQVNLPSTHQSGNAPIPKTTKILKFQVYRDENAPPSRPSLKPTLTQTALPFAPIKFEDGGNIFNTNLEGTEDEHEERQFFAKSGRFAHFDVMTPITERTFEFTTSTRVVDTPGSEPSSMYDRAFVATDAQDVAEKLAAETQADEKETATVATRSPLLGPRLLIVDESASTTEFSFFDQPRTTPFRVSDGFTIEPKQTKLLSSEIVVDSSSITDDLTQALVANSGFKPTNPCVPSDPAVLSKLMSLFPPNLDHRDLGHVVMNHLGRLQRFAEKRARRGSGGSNSGRTSDGSDKLDLELGGDQFEVLEKLGEGGFGAVFMARSIIRATGGPEETEEYDERDEYEDKALVAVKVVHPTNRWESFVLHRVISAIPDDLRRSIIRPHTLYAYRDESYLVLDLCQQGTLLEIVNRAAETGVAQPGGSVDELLVMFFTVELLHIIEGLHDRGFIHGDLKIDNCLIRLEDVPGGSAAWSSEYSPTGTGGWAYKGIKLIDFGRTIDTKLFPAGQTFLADWKTDAPDSCCAEMRKGQPWTFQTDYAGLASIVYCMLFGKHIETAEAADGQLRPAQPMKRYWHADLWTRLFGALLNPCTLRANGSLPVTEELAELRAELEGWIQANCNKGGRNLKGMLKKIEIATLRRGPRK